eukprot:3403668-Rhodomonas_salina.1
MVRPGEGRRTSQQVVNNGLGFWVPAPRAASAGGGSAATQAASGARVARRAQSRAESDLSKRHAALRMLIETDTGSERPTPMVSPRQEGEDAALPENEEALPENEEALPENEEALCESEEALEEAPVACAPRLDPQRGGPVTDLRLCMPFPGTTIAYGYEHDRRCPVV